VPFIGKPRASRSPVDNGGAAELRFDDPVIRSGEPWSRVQGSPFLRLPPSLILRPRRPPLERRGFSRIGASYIRPVPGIAFIPIAEAVRHLCPLCTQHWKSATAAGKSASGQ
jgi:hypothetical protein